MSNNKDNPGEKRKKYIKPGSILKQWLTIL